MQARDAAPLNLNQDDTRCSPTRTAANSISLRWGPGCGGPNAIRSKRREFITGLGGGLRATLKFLQRAELSRALPCASSLTVY